MAIRLNRRHTEMVLQKIQVSQLVNRLQSHALGEIEMTKTQIVAAKILLGKRLADQKAVEHSGEIGRKQPSEMSMAEINERLAQIARRRGALIEGTAAPSSSPDDPSGIH
jgi:hypothetical protein